ncbi:MAG: flavocytochrome c [Clostridia bacterium]|nr:flavocytochrome c [Clostridia bacterium]
MKKFLSLLLCVAMLMGCAGAVAEGWNDGTTTGTAAGLFGDITVEVTVENGAITAINLVKTNETENIWNTAWPTVADAIIAAQSTDVDVVSGATFASNGIMNAVKVALGEIEGETKEEAVLPESADVVIIGGGGAGLTAAVTAAQAGSSVVLVEKMGALGGNTKIAGQGFNAADPARQEKMEMDSALVETLKAYLELDPADFGDFGPVLETVKGQINDYLASGATYLFDTPELHMLHCYMGGTRTGLNGETISPDLALIDVFAHGANDSLTWLESIGGAWNDTTSTILGAMWPRSHGLANGNVIDTLQAAAEKEGVQIFVNTAATELVVDDNGAVTGVVVETENGEKKTITANKGVVLASGGFAANAPLVVEYNNYWPGLSDTMASTNAHGITGDGILMAREIGAELTGMGYAQLMPSSAPSDGSLFTGIWGSAEGQLFVNKEGKRYVNEYAERDVLAKAALEQTDGLFFIICDNDVVGTVDPARVKQLEEGGYVYTADTLEELAEKMGVPADVLVETVNTYNQYTLDKHDPEFGKELFGTTIDEAPFSATPRSPSLHHTMGGVKIDTDTHVINTNGEVIKGLYAAGEVCGGIHAGNRLGGNAMTDFLVFGRIAGQNAADCK